MRDTARVPASREGLLDFPSWLELESAAALSAAIAGLQATGASFNIGVRTKMGELLEADGRAAGRLATLRLRPLSGERRHFTELAHDVRKLSKQVERLSAILDGAPLPIWLKDAADHLIWVNRAYLNAVDSDDIDKVVAESVELVPALAMEFGAANDGPLRRARAHAVIDGAKCALDVYHVPLAEGSAGFAVDVTALEESQKELKRHIRAHANTLDKIATAIAVFGPDQKLRFFNTSYAELWDLDPAWLESRPSDGEILDLLRTRRKLPNRPITATGRQGSSTPIPSSTRARAGGICLTASRCT